MSILEKNEDIYAIYYNLEAIKFLSYRIDSRYAKVFREWGVNALCEYNRMEKKPRNADRIQPRQVTNIHL